MPQQVRPSHDPVQSGSTTDFPQVSVLCGAARSCQITSQSLQQVNVPLLEVYSLLAPAISPSRNCLGDQATNTALSWRNCGTSNIRRDPVDFFVVQLVSRSRRSVAFLYVGHVEKFRHMSRVPLPVRFLHAAGTEGRSASRSPFPKPSPSP